MTGPDRAQVGQINTPSGTVWGRRRSENKPVSLGGAKFGEAGESESPSFFDALDECGYDGSSKSSDRS